MSAGGRRGSLVYGTGSPVLSLKKMSSPIVEVEHVDDSVQPETSDKLRRSRSASPLVSKTAYRSPVILSSARQMIIRRSWMKMSKRQLGNSVMQRLMSSNSEAKRIFTCQQNGVQQSSSMERHAKHVIDLIDCTVDNLHDMDDSALAPWVTLVGRGHSEFSIKSNVWDAFGQAISEIMTEHGGSSSLKIGGNRNRKELRRSWNIVGSFLADRLNCGCRAASSLLSPLSPNPSPSMLDLLVLDRPPSPSLAPQLHTNLRKNSSRF